MPELIIKYKSKKTLDVLLDISKYFDFAVILPKTKSKKVTQIKGVSIISGDSSIDIADLQEIFSGKKFNAKELRKTAWLRKK